MKSIEPNVKHQNIQIFPSNSSLEWFEFINRITFPLLLYTTLFLRYSPCIQFSPPGNVQFENDQLSIESDSNISLIKSIHWLILCKLKKKTVENVFSQCCTFDFIRLFVAINSFKSTDRQKNGCLRINQLNSSQISSIIIRKLYYAMETEVRHFG